MRTRKKKWTDAELENNPLILRDDTTVLAGGVRAFHLEIGCGKGRFITEMARLNPCVQFIGLERDAAILASAARLASEKLAVTEEEPQAAKEEQPLAGSVEQDAGISMPLFITAEVAELEQFFSPGSIARLYINFCDPWPNKKKWAKRRLTHGNFLEIYERLLIPEIFFKTDNRLLFEFSIESLSARGWKLRNVSLDLHKSGMEGNVMTEYEEKYSSKGMPIYRLEAITSYL